MSDLDNEEIEATKNMLNISFDKNLEETINSYTEKWYIQFIKEQENFIEEECIKHWKQKDLIRIYRISEKELDLIFHLGLMEYVRRKKIGE